MAISKLPSWLHAVLATAVLSIAIGFAIAMPALGLLTAAVVSSLIVYVPFMLGDLVFDRVESMGRATGQTRSGLAGGFIAETTTTRMGWWLAGLTSAVSGALILFAVALSQGVVHITW